jgi:hypothetical protein
MSRRSVKKKDTAIVPEVVEPTLSRRDQNLVVALLANPKMTDAARVAGVSESTIWRRLQDDTFQKLYREAQDKAFNSALGVLHGAGTEAIAALQENLTCGVPAAENQAAKTILDYTLKVREQFNLEERIKELESAIRARENAQDDHED